MYIKVNNVIRNNYIVKRHQQDLIEIIPLLKGGGEIKLTFINARGMPTDRKLRHKMKAINLLTETSKIKIYTETATT